MDLDPRRGIDASVPEPTTEPLRAEARFRAVFESSAIGIGVVDSNGTIVEANAAFARMLGYGVDELRGMSYPDLSYPEDVEAARELASRLLSGERSGVRVEMRYVRKDGALVWGRLTASRLSDPEEERAMGLLLVEDITSEKDAEEARATAEHRYRTLIETMPAVTYVWESTVNKSRGAYVTYTSPQVEQLLGFTAEEWEGDPALWTERLHPDDRDAVIEATAESERDGVPFSAEYRYLAKDGRVVWVRDEALLIERTADGRPWRFQGVMMDVTDRKLVEESLAITTERLEAVLEASPLAIVTVDLDGIVRTWNPAAERILGWRADEAVGRYLPHMPPDLRDEFDRLRDGVLATGEVAEVPATRRRRKDGTPIDLMISSGPLHDRSGKVVGLTAVLVDITETREAQRRLTEAERRYRTLVEAVPAVTYLDRITNADGIVAYEKVYVSPQVETILGYPPQRWGDELLWEQVLHPEDRERVLSYVTGRVRDEEPVDVEYRLLAADGHVVWVREQSMPLREGGDLYWQGVMYDITGAKDAELALRDAEQRYRSLVEQIPAVTFADDSTPEHASLYISPQVVDLLGIRAEDAMRDTSLYRRHLHPDDAGWVWERWDRAVAAGDAFEAEYRVIHEDGRIRWVWERSAIIRSEESPSLIQGVLFDITDRKAAEEVLRNSEAEVRRSLELLRRTDDERRELLRHLVASEAAERGRMAEGIEDRSLQDMTALGLRLQTLRRGLEDPEQQGTVDRLGETVQQALTRLRHLLVELRPRELDREGLAAALEHYLRAVVPAGTATRMENRLAAEPELEVRALAYRICQDVIAAAVDRAPVSRIAVDVEGRDDGTLVRVRDDGADLEPPDLSSPGRLAVLSMRERAEIAGGWLRTRSTPGEGTTVELWLPGRLAAAP